jgi:peroxiredoxin
MILHRIPQKSSKRKNYNSGDKVTAQTQAVMLRKGQLVPNFRLPAVNRDREVGPWDYKQHRNLVIIFFRSAECPKCKQLLREIAEHYGDYEQKEAEVLAISSDELDRLRQLALDLALPFPLLSDSDGKVTALYVNHPEQIADKTFDVAIFIADRWGAVFSTKMVEIDHDLPVEAEVRDWLEFIELQCEECFPSEWTH